MWVLLLLSAFFPAIKGIEENTTSAPVPSTSRPSALFLIALGHLSFITVDLDNQNWVIIRGPNLSRESSSKISYLGPREAAENPKMKNESGQEILPS